MTHFPIALVVCSVACDGLGLWRAGRAEANNLQAAGFWMILLAAAGATGAVFSGVILTHGSVLGHGALRWHHLFVWPSFALLVGMAVWRITIGRRATRAMMAGYLVVALATAALVSAAGYWGGELLLRGID